MATGTYTGDGAPTQAIVGVGFQPRFLIVYEQADGAQDYSMTAFKTDQDGIWTSFHGGGMIRYGDDMIISLDADGFTVGDGTGYFNYFNAADHVYTYVAFR